MMLESNADKAYQHDLPKVSFRIITDDKSLFAPAGVQSEQSRSYGYNNSDDFERPEHYIRYIEPIESELAVQVEYDMDEQDQEWLDALNAERKKDQSGPISYEVFEIIMDKLEKEWFNLSKRIPVPVTHMPVEDSKCSICDDGEGENSNAIVFCDGCNLAVHQDCYGVPYIPEGQWLCRKCTVSPENPVSCIFCPNEGGAFKQTTTGHWAHLLCAIFIPETGLGNAIYMEPVEGVETVPKNRWKLVCSLCRERTGACIQCDNKNCFTAFHVTCARQLGLLQSMKDLNQDGVLKAFCSKHLPAESRDDDDESETASNFSDIEAINSPKRPSHLSQAHAQPRKTSGPIIIPVTKKSAQAHSKSFRPGPPIVPKIIVNKLLEYVAKISIRKKQPFVERLCRYWSLKREARRGAPLLKRLHLEPWTASSAARQQTDAEKAQKLKFLQMLRNDLEKVRMLAELVRKREKEKLRQAQIIKDVVDSFIFPHYGKLRLALEKISAMDRQEMFLSPVNRQEVPDYFEIVKEPMCWLYIDEKLEKNEYVHVAEFKRHITLVLDNAMLYNPRDNPYHRAAARIKKNAQEFLDDLDTLTGSSNSIEFGDYRPGDLEPSLILLNALQHPSSESEQDLLGSIFAFEMEKPKPPKPPTPPKSIKGARKPYTAAEKKQRWEERDAAAKERLGERSTRANAVARAWAEEAGSPGSSNLEASGSGAQTPAGAGDGDGGRDARSRRRSGRNAAPTASAISEEQFESKATNSPSPPKRSDDSNLRRHAKPQRGVVGVETIAVLTDKERRELERQLDLVTQSVDPLDQFKRFNVGWVLPEGSTRKRAERVSEPPRSTPSRRRSEGSTSQKPPSNISRLSKTPKAERKSLPPVEEAPTPVDRASEGSGNASGSDSELSPPPPSGLTSATNSPRRSMRAKPGPNVQPAVAGGTGGSGVQLERGKEEEEVEGESITAALALSSASASAPASASASGSRQKRKAVGSEEPAETPRASKRARTRGAKVAQEEDQNEALEELEADAKAQTEAGDEDVDVGIGVVQDSGVAVKNSSGAKGKDKDKDKDMDKDKDKEKVDYKPKMLVWAKFQSFPYFPARIISPTSPSLPAEVLADKTTHLAMANKKSRPLFLVKFFDWNSSYGWVTDDRLEPLGTDEGLDALYLAGKEKGRSKGFKSSGMRQGCRKGYREALASRDKDGEDDEDEDEDGEESDEEEEEEEVEEIEEQK